MGQEAKYDIYMMGAISGVDGPRTKEYRALMGDVISRAGHHLLSPHVAYDFEQTAFRQRVGGRDGISIENERLMRQADVFVGEGSGASDGRGFEVCYGLYILEVPVLMFRYEGDGLGSSMIFGKQHPLLYYALYNFDNLSELMVDALSRVPVMIAAHHEMKGKQ